MENVGSFWDRDAGVNILERVSWRECVLVCDSVLKHKLPSFAEAASEETAGRRR